MAQKGVRMAQNLTPRVFLEDVHKLDYFCNANKFEVFSEAFNPKVNQCGHFIFGSKSPKFASASETSGRGLPSDFLKRTSETN